MAPRDEVSDLDAALNAVPGAEISIDELDAALGPGAGQNYTDITSTLPSTVTAGKRYLQTSLENVDAVVASIPGAKAIPLSTDPDGGTIIIEAPEDQGGQAGVGNIDELDAALGPDEQQSPELSSAKALDATMAMTPGIGMSGVLMNLLGAGRTMESIVSGEAAKSAGRGVVQGATFGVVAPGEEPVTGAGKAAGAIGAMIGSIPWFLASEAVATTAMVKLGLRGLTPLSHKVLEFAGTGAVFESAGQIAREGIQKPILDPLEYIKESARGSIMFSAMAPAVHYLPMLFAAKQKMPEEQFKQVSQAFVEEVEKMVHRPGPSRFQIIEALRATQRIERGPGAGQPGHQPGLGSFSLMFTRQDVAAIESNPEAKAIVEAITSGRASFIGNGRVAKYLRADQSADAMGNVYTKIVEDVPQVDPDKIITAMRSARQNNVPLSALLTKEELAILESNPAVKNIIEENAKLGVPIDPFLTDAERKVFYSQPKPAMKWDIEFGPLDDPNTAAGEIYRGRLYYDSGMELEARMTSRVLNTELSPAQADPALVGDVVRHKYKKDATMWDLAGKKDEMYRVLEQVKSEPRAWQDAVKDYAKDNGYDAAKFGPRVDAVRLENFDVRLTPEMRAAARKSLPELLPDELVDNLPGVRDVVGLATGRQPAFFAKMRGRSKYSGTDLWDFLERMPRDKRDKVIRGLYDDPEANAVLEAMPDITEVEVAWGDPINVFRRMDPSGILLRRYYALQMAEVGARRFSTKLKLHTRQVLGVESGSEESAAIMRIGEKRAEPGDIKYDTPATQKKILQMRQLYDWMRDRINEARAVNGLKPIVRRDDYFTHIDELSHWEKVYGGLQHVPDAKANTPFLNRKDPKFAHEHRRIGSEFADDAIGGIEKYIDSTSKYLHLADPGMHLMELAKKMPDRMRALTELSVQLAYGRSNAVSSDGLSRFLNNSTPGYIMRWAGERANRNTITRLGTAVVQAGSFPFIVGKAGIKNTLKAVADMVGPMRAEYMRVANEISPAVASHTADFNELLPQDIGLISDFVRRIGRSLGNSDLQAKALQAMPVEKKLADALSVPIKLMDQAISHIAWRAFLNQADELGLKGMERVIWANSGVDAVNSTYLPSSTPRVLANDAVKFVLPFKRQLVKLANTVYADIINLPSARREAARLILSQSGSAPSSGAVARYAGNLAKAAEAQKAVPIILRIYATGVVMEAVRRSLLESLGVEQSRESFEPMAGFIPLYDVFVYGMKAPILSAGGDVLAGVGQAIAGDTEKASKRFVRAGAMVAPPAGGRQFLDLMEGNPLGKERIKQKNK